MEDVRREILARVAEGTLTPQDAAAELRELEGSTEPATPVAEAPPPTDLARVRVVASMGRVVILGDESVREAVADGPQQVHREGDTLVIESTYDDGAGFTFGRVHFGFDLPDPRLLVRMNPSLLLDAEVKAGSLRIQGVRSRIRAEVQAGSTRIEGFSAPLDLDVQAGSVKASGLLSGGSSRIRCQAGSVSLDLDPRSSVTIKAKTSLGRVSLPDSKAVSGIGGGVARAQVGEGAGTLDIQNEMGSVTVSVSR